ncbi:MAG: HAMP domain-containing histidine kinase [Flavobacteriaceae bacterium]|nr:HAMP domain-containing histidine kinase [Flavobacteriaceae bacterium]
MNFSKNATITRWILITISFIIVASILWSTYDFFQKYKLEERNKMEIIAEAQKALEKDLNTSKEFNIFRKIILNSKIIDFKTKRKILNNNNKHKYDSLSLNSNSNDNLILLILSSNSSVPSIITTKNDVILNSNNLNPKKEKDTVYLRKQLAIMKKQNKPIVLTFAKNTQRIYYRDSDLLSKLKYYPLALLLILTLFGAVIYLVLKSSKVAIQNKLWTGMAKETAHQIGTPLSSLLGWVEILRMDNVAESIVTEIEKDVFRLNTIADRFSKIGSRPKLEKINLVVETQKSFDYLKSRSSKQIDFSFNSNESVIFVNANKQLYSWVIENIIKNAIDAMQGKGKLDLTLKLHLNNVEILITDSGKGIAKNQFKKIFETGFTTKKRGWGLGLSLTKRIIENYHNGSVYVKNSTLGKGTSILISLKKLDS